MIDLESGSNDRHPVDVLVELFSEAIRRGEEISVEAFAAQYPEHRDLLQSVLPAIAIMERSQVAASTSKGGSSSTVEPVPLSALPNPLGDFQILREIGRGGMGVVYEAIQLSLQRHVALKVVNWTSAENKSHRARFRREAEAAASLHHTNIVPIFGIGESHGLQYYAMQLIDGVTLHDIVTQLLSRAPASQAESIGTAEARSNATMGSQAATMTKLRFDPNAAARLLLHRSATEVVTVGASMESLRSKDGWNAAHDEVTRTQSWHDATQHEEGDRSELQWELDEQTSATPKLTLAYYRNVASMVANIANALEHAHHVGILHRDIKPANLLLDRDGTVWITDFGLARRTDLDGATQTGEILGTLRYMAPEQMVGGGDHRIDIYSLGLTLYEMLTLTPAISSPKARLLDPERNSAIIPPKQIQPNIPRDLQTITMKACAHEPGLRYQRAKEFEEDLRRFLEDRPILARRASIAEQLMRWARRNPAISILMSTTMGLLLIIAVLLGIWNRQMQVAIGRYEIEYDRAEENLKEKTLALEDVKRESRRAELNLELALNAFDQIMDNLASRGNSFGSGGDLDEESLAEFADATLSQADVKLLQSLLDFFDRFAKENAKDLRVEVAVARRRMGEIQHKIGNLDEAERLFLLAIEDFKNIRKQRPHELETVMGEFAIYHDLIIVLAKRVQMNRVNTTFQAARKLLDAEPQTKSSADGRFALAKLLNTMGTIGTKFGGERRNRPLLGAVNRNAAAPLPQPLPNLAMIKREAGFNSDSLQLLNELVKEKPDNDAYQIALARATRDQAKINRALNELPTADQNIDQAIRILEGLCSKHPDSVAYQYELADTLSTNILLRPIDAERCQRSLKIISDLLKSHPTAPEYLALKASVQCKLARMTLGPQNDRNSKSESLLLDSIRIQSELCDRFPDIVVYKIALIQTYVQSAELQVAMRKPEKAKEYFDIAIRETDSIDVGPNLRQMIKNMSERLKDRRANLNP